MARMKGDMAVKVTPWRCISSSSDCPWGSTKSSSARSRTVLRSCVVDWAVSQHWRSSATHGPESLPSSLNRSSLALSCRVIFNIHRDGCTLHAECAIEAKTAGYRMPAGLAPRRLPKYRQSGSLVVGVGLGARILVDGLSFTGRTASGTIPAVEFLGHM